MEKGNFLKKWSISITGKGRENTISTFSTGIKLEIAPQRKFGVME